MWPSTGGVSHVPTCTGGQLDYQNKDKRSSNYNTHRGTVTSFFHIFA